MSYHREKANGRQRGCSQRVVRSPAKPLVRGAQTELRRQRPGGRKPFRAVLEEEKEEAGQQEHGEQLLQMLRTLVVWG